MSENCISTLINMYVIKVYIESTGILNGTFERKRSVKSVSILSVTIVHYKINANFDHECTSILATNSCEADCYEFSFYEKCKEKFEQGS